jgi:hypothetical protein
MKKLLLNFIVSLFCLLLAVAQVLATEYTEAANNLQVEWVAGDGTDVYNFTGDNVQAIRSERGFATVNITGTGSVVADNCSEHGCPGQYFNGQFADAFAGADATTLAQHYPPWYGIRYPSTASNCVIASGAVACTPVLGSERLTNGTFTTWSGDNATGWNNATAESGTDYITESSSAALIVSDGGWGIHQTIATDEWRLYSGNCTTYTSGRLAVYNVGSILDPPIAFDAAGRKTGIKKATGDNTLWIFSYPATANMVVDDMSVKGLIWSTFLSNVTDYKFKTEVKYSADLTIADGDIAMIAFKVGDLTAGSEDFCRVELNKGTGKVELKKAVAGTETTPLSAEVTYVAGATLLVQTDATDTDGTKWEVYYNGSQVGTDQTLNEASLNSAVAGFMATSASTTFDNWKAGKNI